MGTNRFSTILAMFFLTLITGPLATPAATTQPATLPTTQSAVVEKWGVFEASLLGPTDGNPFIDVSVSARFTRDNQYLDVPGFYDGDGKYLLRFQPNEKGDWHYLTHSNRPELDGKTGSFTAVAATGNNHGPVVVRNTFHFGYADNSAYFPIGTTCYYWAMQSDAVEDQTLASLKTSPFNKLRMFTMPAAEGSTVPLYPFAGEPPKKWDFTRFDPKYFQSIDRRLSQLQNLGIEADLILFNPYDRGKWGFDYIGPANEDRYLRYAVARWSAYRNVWWSLSNEFDLFKNKSDSDWDRLFHILEGTDPYHHLRSIHHSQRLYDYNKPWISHASLQNGSAVEDFGRAELYRDVYNKPIVLDEVKYEGNSPQRWGQLTGQEMVARFWQGTIAGTYVGHGEVLLDPKTNASWTNNGGELKGQSVPRLAFLKKILATAPIDGLDPIDKWQDLRTVGQGGQYYLIYFGNQKPDSWLFELPKAGLKNGMKFHIDVLDTWDMTVTPIDQEFVVQSDGKYRFHAKGLPKIALPGKPYMALRITATK